MEYARTVCAIGRDFNIGHLTPETGGFILKRLLREFNDFVKGLDGEGADPNAPKPSDEEFAETLIQQMLMNLDEKDLANIQRHCLNVVSFTDVAGEREFEQPILLRSGIYSLPELRFDIGTIDYLVSQTLYANLTPFFTPTGLKAALKGQLVVSSR